MGPDVALWFTEYTGNKIGRITTAGAIAEYPVPTPDSAPHGIVAGPDGAVWFTEHYAGKIGRITTSGSITEYVVPTPGSYPAAIVPGPDGALWFAEHYTNKIGRITTAGAITEYEIPTANSYPVGIALGPDGALWFTEYATSKLGRITTAGAITEYPIPTANSSPIGIATGSDGELWFAEYTGDKIGQAVFVTAGLTVSPATGGYRASLTFTGSGFAADEAVRIYSSGIGSVTLASARTGLSGTFNANANEPSSPYGPRIFLAQGQTSGRIGAASFSVTARLTLKPTSGPVGSQATAQAYGFGAGELVDIYWSNPRNLLGKTTADIHGSFSGFAFTVPLNASPGANRVSATGETTGAKASATFTVAAP